MADPILLNNGDVWAVIPRFSLGAKVTYHFRTYRIIVDGESETTNEQLAQEFGSDQLFEERRCISNRAVIEDIWIRRVFPTPAGPDQTPAVIVGQPNFPSRPLPPQCSQRILLGDRNLPFDRWARYYVPFIPQSGYPGGESPSAVMNSRLESLGDKLCTPILLSRTDGFDTAVPVVWDRNTGSTTDCVDFVVTQWISNLNRRSYHTFTNDTPF